MSKTLGHNFRNNYEVAVDSFGTMWQSDNDDDGNKGVRINYVMEWGKLWLHGRKDRGRLALAADEHRDRDSPHALAPERSRHRAESAPDRRRFADGYSRQRRHGLGPKFTNQLIHCDAGPRTVRAYPVENNGAGYSATMVDILTSTDSWYRASDVDIAPDGSLFVADWYDPGVGGHAMGDNVPGKMMGRIYRVASTSGKYSIAAPDFSSAESCVKALTSPNRPRNTSHGRRSTAWVRKRNRPCSGSGNPTTHASAPVPWDCSRRSKAAKSNTSRLASRMRIPMFASPRSA